MEEPKGETDETFGKTHRVGHGTLRDGCDGAPSVGANANATSDTASPATGATPATTAGPAKHAGPTEEQPGFG